MIQNQYISLDDHTNYYYSNDLGLVAYLTCDQRYELESLDKAIINRVVFILRRNGRDIESDVNDYWNGDTSVDAQKYFNQLKSLKSQIYSKY